MPCEQKLPNGQPCPHPAIFHCSECRIGLCEITKGKYAAICAQIEKAA
jgi:hypothetical protein